MRRQGRKPVITRPNARLAIPVPELGIGPVSIRAEGVELVGLALEATKAVGVPQVAPSAMARLNTDRAIPTNGPRLVVVLAISASAPLPPEEAPRLAPPAT